MWVVGLPLGLWLGFARKMGAVGLWIGLAAGVVGAGVALITVWARTCTAGRGEGLAMPGAFVDFTGFFACRALEVARYYQAIRAVKRKAATLMRSIALLLEFLVLRSLLLLRSRYGCMAPRTRRLPCPLLRRLMRLRARRGRRLPIIRLVRVRAGFRTRMQRSWWT